MSGAQGTRELKSLIKKLRTVEKEGMLKVAKVLAIAAEGLVIQGFEDKTDPYGNEWAAVKRKGIPLNKNGHLKSSWSAAEVTSSGFKIVTNSPYAHYHQDGVDTIFKTGPNKDKPCKIAVRMMIPNGNDLPKSWDTEFRAVARAKLAAMLGAK